jgi:hypothetical protein
MAEGRARGSLPLVPMHVNTDSSSSLNCRRVRGVAEGQGQRCVSVELAKS